MLRRLRDYHVRISEGFGRFAELEASGAVVLIAATVTAVVLANSPWHEAFSEFWHAHLAISFGEYRFDQSLLHWIDDGLMALFFFVVGLEIKREVIAGELSTLRHAALPIIAAVGGMLAPALVYLAINAGGDGVAGWGIPMTTDIAFALGVLAMLGRRAPTGLKVFLAALAIADDIGAVLMIAVFYTAQITWSWLLPAGLALLILLVLNGLRVESPIPYVFAGVFVWFCFLNSGVHATIAGVLVALTIPSKSRMEPMEFVRWARGKIEEIATLEVPGAHVLESPGQQHKAQEIQAQARWIQAPLQRMEHALLPVTSFVVLPLFALANAGVTFIGMDLGALLTERVSLGVILGLLVGKQLGVLSFTWVTTRFGIADLPEGVTWRHIYGAAWLAGIGFTMSLFISGLAFRAGVLQDEAKLAILVASLAAGVGGYLVLRGARPQQPAIVEDAA